MISRDRISLFLSLIPLAFLVSFVFVYKIDAPIADEWAMVPLIQKSFIGSLTVHDLWVQHNEHRIFFPKLVIITLARFTQWNIAYELAFDIILALVVFVVLAYQFGLAATQLHLQLPFYFLPIISLLIFSLSQSENWFWGIQMQVFMSVCATVLGVMFLTQRPLKWRYFISAIIFGFIATFSSGNGLAYWPVGLFLLFFSSLPGSVKKSLVLPIWVISGSMAVIVYFYDYQQGMYHPSIGYIGGHFWDYLDFVLSFLGAPLVAFCKKGPVVSQWLSENGLNFTGPTAFLFAQASTLLGLAGMLIVVYASWYLFTRYRAEFLAFLPFLGYGVYAIVTAFIIAYGRFTFGSTYALSLRYITISSFLWVPIILFLFFLKQRMPKAQAIIGIGMIALTICLLLNSMYGSLYAIKRYDLLHPAQEELLILGNEEIANRLDLPSGSLKYEYVHFLKAYRLNIFRQPNSKPEFRGP